MPPEAGCASWGPTLPLACTPYPEPEPEPNLHPNPNQGATDRMSGMLSHAATLGRMDGGGVSKA